VSTAASPDWPGLYVPFFLSCSEGSPFTCVKIKIKIKIKNVFAKFYKKAWLSKLLDNGNFLELVSK
jgi:hypothetical protein